MAIPTLEQWTAMYDQPQGRGWTTDEMRNIQTAYQAAYPQAAGGPTQQDLNDFKASLAAYGQPAGRDWYSHEISNIAQNFANSKGRGGDANYVGSLAGGAFPGTTFNQAPASEFAEGQDNGDSMFDGVGGLLALAAIAAGGYGLSGLFGGAGAGAGALGEGALASTLAAEGSSGLLGAGLGSSAAAGAGAASGLGSLGSGTFGLDLAGLGGTATGAGASTGLGSLGIGATGTGLTAAGGGAVGSGLAGLGAADLAAAGLGGLAGAGTGLGAAANAAGSLAGDATIASGTGGGSSGGEMDWLDELINSTQNDPIWNTSGDLGGAIGGTNPYGGDLGLPNGTLPDGSVDVGASWQNQLQAALSGMPNLPPGLSSAIKALAGGGSGSSSLLGLLGKGLGGVLDYTASSKAADNAKEIADRTWGAGQQYRDNASRAMTPGFDLNSIPGYSGALSTGMDAFNRSLSAKNGNPWGQGGAAGEAISWAGKTIGLPAWQNYFNSNSNAGGLSNLATQSTTAGLNAGAADQATYGSLGQTARNIFDPQPDYQKQYLELLGKQYGLA